MKKGSSTIHVTVARDAGQREHVLIGTTPHSDAELHRLRLSLVCEHEVELPRQQVRYVQALVRFMRRSNGSYQVLVTICTLCFKLGQSMPERK